MKVLFVQSGYESLGVELLSAVLRRGGHQTALAFDPRLFDDHYTRAPALACRLDMSAAVIRQAEQARPELIALSVVTDDYPWALGMARALRYRLKVPVVMGGVHVTAVPERVMQEPAVDYAVVGEGEGALLELADALEAGAPVDGIQNLWSRRGGRVVGNPVRPLEQDLDALPFPDKQLFHEQLPYLRRDHVIMTSRGCPHRCAYCFNGSMQRLYAGKGPWVRRRGVEDTLEELRQARAVAHPPRRIMFYDDAFTDDRAWLEAFSRGYIRDIALPFWCTTNPAAVDDRVARLLRRMGCFEVQLGVQTVDRRLRRRVLGRPESVEQVRAAVTALQAEGIKVVLDSISGIPGEGEDELARSLAFYNEVRPSRLSDYYLRYYPGTRATREAHEAGVLDDAQVLALEQGHGSESFALGGTLHGGGPVHARLHLLRALLLRLPAPLNRLILRRRLYRLMPESVPLLRGLLRLAEAARGQDINAQRYVGKYVHFLSRALATRSGKTRSSSK